MPYTFPTQQMITVLADLHTFDKELFITPDILPIDGESFNDSPAMVMWDVVEPTQGITALSDFDAQPTLITQRAVTTKTAAPMVFRDAVRIGEKQLIQMRKPGSSTQRDGDGSIYRAVNQLNNRLDALIEASNFQALSGTLTMDGTTVDYGFTAAQTPNVATSAGYGGEYWDNPDAAIRKDIDTAVSVLDGAGVSKIVMIADKSVYALMSRNEAFIKGFYGSPMAGEIGANKLTIMLPDYLGCGVSECRLSSQCYKNDQGVKTKFADPTKVYFVGFPTEGELGCWASTPNTYNGGTGGRFIMIDDHSADRPVPYVDLVGGIMGLPVLYQPQCVVCMQVLAS